MRKQIAMGSLSAAQYHSPTDSPELGPLAKTIEEIVDNSTLEATVKETWKAALTKFKNNELLSAEAIQSIKDLSLFSRISNPDGMYDDAAYALHKKMLAQGIEITPYINVRLLDAFETLKISLHAEGKTPPKLFQSQESWKGIPWENDTDVEFYRIKNASGQKVSYASVVLSKSDEALLIADDEEVSQLSESMAAASMADSGGASAGSTAPSKTEDLQEAKQAVETQWVIESSSRTITKKGHTAVDHIQPFAIIRERMQKVLTHLSQNRTLAKHALQLSDLKTGEETQISELIDRSDIMYTVRNTWRVNQQFRGACLGFVAKAWLHKNPRYFLTVLATEKSHEKSLRLLYFVQDVLDQLSLAPRERELLTTLVNQLKQQYEGLSATRNALRNAIEKILGDHEGELQKLGSTAILKRSPDKGLLTESLMSALEAERQRAELERQEKLAERQARLEAQSRAEEMMEIATKLADESTTLEEKEALKQRLQNLKE